MRYSRASGVVVLTLVLTACNAGQATAPPAAPQPEAPTPTTAPNDVGRTNVGITSTEGGDEVQPLDRALTVPGDAATTAGGVVDIEVAVPDQSATGSESTTDVEPDPGTTTTPTNAVATDELDELVDDVTDLLSDLAVILGDLDAELDTVQDGMNQEEGDI